MKKYHEGEKVLAEFDMPDWFLSDVNIPFNALLKDIGMKTLMTTHNKKEIDEFHDELKEKFDRDDIMSIKSYFSMLKQALWAKLEILEPNSHEFEVLHYCPEEKKIYAVDEMNMKSLRVEIDTSPKKKINEKDDDEDKLIDRLNFNK